MHPLNDGKKNAAARLECGNLNVGNPTTAVFPVFPQLSIDATYGSTPPLFLEWVRNPQRKLSEIVFPAPEAGQK